MGSSHIRVGNDDAQWSNLNPIAYDNIVDGGFQEFTGVFSGRYLTLRRDLGVTDSQDRYGVRKLKVYQTPNLIKSIKQAFKLQLTQRLQ